MLLHLLLATIVIVLPPSSLPVSADECERVRPDLGRPTYTVSMRGDGTPWDIATWRDRTCVWVVSEKKK